MPFDRSRSLLGAALAASVVLVAPAMAYAQAGVTVEGITFEGNDRYADETLRLAIRTKVGQKFDRALLNQDIETLYSFFDTVRVEETQTPEGIRIQFVVSENPLVTDVGFTGIDGGSQNEVEDVIETQRGRPLADFRLENDRRRVERLYRRRGFHFVEVLTSTSDYADGKRVVFDILEGPRVEVTDIVFSGNESLADEELDDQMATGERGFLGLAGGDFVEEFLRQDLLTLTNHYRAEGWLDASVELLDLVFNEDRSRVEVRIGVTEGTKYRFGTTAISGGESFPGGAEALREYIRTDEGARRRQADISSTIDALEEAYRGEGYFNVRVVPEEVARPEGSVVDITYRIEERAKTFVRDVKIIGNTITRDKVLRREMRGVFPGAVLNSNEIRKSLARLRGLGYFRSVSVDVKNPPEGEDPNQKDVVYEVDDTAPTGRVRFAAGISSDLGFIGSITVTKRNFDWTDLPERFGEIVEGKAFSGGGQTLELELSPGSEFSSYRLAFTEPWLFDKPISFGWDLFLTKFQRFDYDVDRKGLSVSLGRRWTFPGKQLDTDIGITGTTRVESIDLDNLTRDTASTAFLAEGSNSLLAQRFSLSYDRTDTPLRPTEGWVAAISTEYGFGGDLRLWKNTINADHYWTVHVNENDRKHVVSLGGQLAYAQALGGSEDADPSLFDEEYVPIYERYFAGGSSLRGFAFGGAGPHGEGNPFRNRKLSRQVRTAASVLENDGDPLGGDLLFTASAQYTFPLYEDTLRGVVFADAGMVRDDFDSAHGLDEGAVRALQSQLLRRGRPGDVRAARRLAFEDETSFFSDIRMAVGVGLRIQIPIFGSTPIALDFGFPVREEDGDDTQVLSFSVSRDF